MPLIVGRCGVDVDVVGNDLVGVADFVFNVLEFVDKFGLEVRLDCGFGVVLIVDVDGLEMLGDLRVVCNVLEEGSGVVFCFLNDGKENIVSFALLLLDISL